MKRYRVLLSLLAILAVVLVACGNGSTTSPSGSSKVTINWWHISTTDPLLTGWQNLANQYMQSHPNVTIKITVIANDPFKTSISNPGKRPPH